MLLPVLRVQGRVATPCTVNTVRFLHPPPSTLTPSRTLASNNSLLTPGKCWLPKVHSIVVTCYCCCCCCWWCWQVLLVLKNLTTSPIIQLASAHAASWQGCCRGHEITHPRCPSVVDAHGGALEPLLWAWCAPSVRPRSAAYCSNPLSHNRRKTRLGQKL